MDTLWQDLRYAIRALIKKPGFTAVALSSLTLGIGANATIFTLVKAIFLQPIPVKDASRVVIVYSTNENRNGPAMNYIASSYPNAVDYREKNDVFQALSMYMSGGGDMQVDKKDVQVGVQLVDDSFFDIVGVKPFLGRAFLPEEDKTPGSHPVAILSYRLWNREFAADKDVVGKSIRIDRQDYAVVGVMPAYFHDAGALGSTDVFVPMMMHDQVNLGTRQTWFPRRAFRMLFMVARLKPGISLQTAQASMTALSKRLEQQFPADNSGRHVTLVPITHTNVPVQQREVFVRAGQMMGFIVALILLIACGNVANLLLARATQRRREFAVRLSLGATRGRLIRQLLTESALLSIGAALLGAFCALWSKQFARLLTGGGFPDTVDFSVDKRVWIYTFCIAVLATAAFGLIPALQASKTSQMDALRDRGDSGAKGGRWYSLRGVLVTVQVAFSLIALVASGLFIHSLKNAQQLDPGFDTTHSLLTFLSPQQQLQYNQTQSLQYFRDALARSAGVPGVVAVGLSSDAPFSNGLRANVFPIESNHGDPRNGVLMPNVSVSSGYFKAAGIAMLGGRDFDEHDDAQAPKVVVVNQAFVDVFWPGQSPIGKHVYLRSFGGSEATPEVIGVVRTVKYNTLGEPPQPILYAHIDQLYSPNLVLFVRTNRDPNQATSSVRSAVMSIDSKMRFGMRTLPDVMDDALSSAKIGAEVLTAFGALALLLAAIGTYGVIAYSVSQRTHEMGVRIALGAQRVNILQLVLAGGMGMVGAGIIAGLILSSLLAGSVQQLLYGIGAFDVPAFAASAALLIGVALIACYLPARRAMRVDPIVALRHE
jgi:predicted permease